MIYWNPLLSVSITQTKITFFDERGIFYFSRPDIMKDWGIIDKLRAGLSTHRLRQASEFEKTLIKSFAQRNLICKTNAHLSDLSEERDAGHYLTFAPNPIKAIERLRSSVVCLLGVGGVGSVVLQHLVALGVRNYVLLDKDVVETSNLNRQFIYTTEDVGKIKVDVAENFIRTRVKNARVVSFSGYVESVRSLEDLSIGPCNILISCLDTPRDTIDDIVYEYGRSNGIPAITAGVGVYYGHWGPLICSGKDSVSYSEWKSIHLRGNQEPRHHVSVPTPWSFGPTNTLIGAQLAREVAEWLGGKADVNSLATRQVQCFANNEISSYRVPA